MGEMKEMGVGASSKFIDLISGVKKNWHDFLGYENYIEGMSVIAGNRGSNLIDGEDDGLLRTDLVKLNSAQFNPVIYASHGHGTLDASDEFSLTECTFVTEFIKKWMIDDEDTYYGAYFVGDPSVGYTNYPPYSLRVWPKINDYKKALTIDISLIRPDNGQVIKRKTVPIFRCHQEFLPYFIGAPVIHNDWTDGGGGYSGNVIAEVTINDMSSGKTFTKQGPKILIYKRDGPVMTHLIYPNGGENLIAGNLY
ncbi:MAG: hypothetical protein ABIN20_07410, partial [candidate division WOR-3 bacterium]